MDDAYAICVCKIDTHMCIYIYTYVCIVHICIPYIRRVLHVHKNGQLGCCCCVCSSTLALVKGIDIVSLLCCHCLPLLYPASVLSRQPNVELRHFHSTFRVKDLLLLHQLKHRASVVPAAVTDDRCLSLLFVGRNRRIAIKIFAL